MRIHKVCQILAVSAALAGYSAWSLAEREPKTAARVDGTCGIPLVRLAQAEQLWRDSSTLFVDVRSGIDYEFGHIAGAVSLPEKEFEKHFPVLKERLERAHTIVVYCQSTDCGLSLWAAIRLRSQGLKQTVIYPEGWNEWYNRERPITRPAS
jgi:rhodanese-related sulfurtransferase